MRHDVLTACRPPNQMTFAWLTTRLSLFLAQPNQRSACEQPGLVLARIQQQNVLLLNVLSSG
jgi:hypothetical protein